MTWNLALLIVLLIGPSHDIMQRIVAGIGFCALSLLPSVRLDLCLANRFPIITRSGYVLGFCAALAHLIEFFYDTTGLHQIGLAIITAGFGMLTVISVLMVLWSGEENPRSLSMRILSTMSLFPFAVSLVHFSNGQSPNPWTAELAVHHGGIPLALFVIMQDYRFAFLDAFIRFLLNGLLAAIFALLIAEYSSHLGFVLDVLCIFVAPVGFGILKGLLRRLLTKLVFRQPDAETAIRDLRIMGAQASNEESYLNDASEYIARSMNAQLCCIRSDTPPKSLDCGVPILVGGRLDAGHLQECGIEVVVPLGYLAAETRHLALGARRGGRRYLSEDLQVLARMAACIGEQIERIRAAETRELVSQAELRALQSQIHPHFLFNAFNTLYGIIPRQGSDARRMLLNLFDIFRYFLQSETTFVPLEQELRIVKAYLDIEESRLRDKLQINIDVDSDVLQKLVPVLSIQPLVENAIKHDVAARPEGGVIRIRASREGDRLNLQVHDTGPGFADARHIPGAHTGAGLENVSRRLALCYGSQAHLQIESGPEGTTVSFLVPWDRAEAKRAVQA